jgi:hypothetical protein
MTKEFDFSISYFDFLKRYLRVYALAIVGIVLVLIRVQSSHWIYKAEIFIGVVIGFPLIYFLSSFFQYTRIRKLKDLAV